MCRYTFINPKLDQTVLSEKSSNTDKEQKRRTFSFDHENVIGIIFKISNIYAVRLRFSFSRNIRFQ